MPTWTKEVVDLSVAGSSLTIDSIKIDGTYIGHTDDTDLLRLTSGNLAVNGNGVFSGALNVASSAVLSGATTIAGATQLNNTLTIGVDNTGYDAKFFGATSGKYMLWDESADTLIIRGEVYADSGQGTANTVFGKDAGSSFTGDDADYNTLFGDSAGKAITSGQRNTLVGFGAGVNITSAEKNVIMGYAAGNTMTTTDDTVLIGYAAGYNLNHGNNSGIVAIGQDCLFSAATVSSINLTAIGNTAGYYCSGSNGSVLLGYEAGKGHSSGWSGGYNTCIGYQAGDSFDGSGAAYNTLVGKECGDGITTGAYNTGLGAACAFDIDADNQTCVGYGATTDSANDIAIGNTSVDEVKGQVDFTTFSDERIKTDIIDGDLGLDFINLLKPRKFKKVCPANYPDAIRKPSDEGEIDPETGEKTPFIWTDAQANKVWDGLIAQEVKTAIDSCETTFSGWNEESNSKQLLTYSTLIIPLIKAVQELSAKVKVLEG